MISERQIDHLLAPYGASLTSDQATKVRVYVSLLLRWNRAVSLTTVRDEEAIIQRHFGESFFAVQVVPLSAGRLADIGSGAGFPGAAIAILCPSIQATLIESNSKKAAFLQTVRSELGLKNLEVAKIRGEDADAILTACDFVTARALGRYRALLRSLSKQISLTAKVILWLGEDDAAGLKVLKEWRWRPQVSVPKSQRRVLLIGSRYQATN